MADKKVVVNLDLNGNTIKNVLMESVSTLPTATSSIVGRFLYNSTDTYVYYCYKSGSDPDTYAWEKMAKGSIVDTIQTNYTTLVGTTLPAMQTQIDNNTAFRLKSGSGAGAQYYADLGAGVSDKLKALYVSADQKIYLSWGGTPSSSNYFAEIDASDFLVDGMLSGVHLYEVKYESNTVKYYCNGTEVTTSTPVSDPRLDGKTLTPTTENNCPTTSAGVGKYLRMVFNTEPADTKSATWVNVSDLVDVYTAGYGINISSGNVVAVKLKGGSGLTSDASGL